MEKINQNITLQKATNKDIPAIIAVEKTAEHLKTYSAMTTEKEWLEEIANNFVYLIKAGDKVAGSIMYEIKEDNSVYISGLVVDPHFQKQGIARIATKKILEERKDTKRFYLVTHPENKTAIKLYESLGFVIEGRKDNYFGDGEPRIVLSLTK